MGQNRGKFRMILQILRGKPVIYGVEFENTQVFITEAQKYIIRPIPTKPTNSNNKEK